MSIESRGWTLDALRIVQQLLEERGSVTRSPPVSNRAYCGSQSRAPSRFTTADVYAFERELKVLAASQHGVGRDRSVCLRLRTKKRVTCPGQMQSMSPITCEIAEERARQFMKV